MEKNNEINGARNQWRKIVVNYSDPDIRKSVWQLVNTFGLYVILWVLMVFSLQVSYWLTLGISVIAAGMLVRIFIIFHDCGHGSFFSRPRPITGLVSLPVCSPSPPTFYGGKAMQSITPRLETWISAAQATCGQ